MNNIVSQYKRTGMISHLAKGVPQYLDVSELGDYRQALDQVRAAEEYFMTLPAGVRKEFDNDPAAFLEFAGSADPDVVRQALESMGEKAHPKKGAKPQVAPEPVEEPEPTPPEPSE